VSSSRGDVLSLSGLSDSESDSKISATSDHCTSTSHRVWFPEQKPKTKPIILPELRPFIDVDVIPALHLKTLRCPITMEVFTDPVIVSDGQTYQIKSITRWLKINKTSPLTKKVMIADELICNIGIQEIIESYYPLDVPQDIPDEANIEDGSPPNSSSSTIQASNADLIIIDDNDNDSIPASVSSVNTSKSSTRVINSSTE